MGCLQAGFLNDTDVLPQSTSNSPRQEPEEVWLLIVPFIEALYYFDGMPLL